MAEKKQQSAKSQAIINTLNRIQTAKTKEELAAAEAEKVKLLEEWKTTSLNGAPFDGGVSKEAILALFMSASNEQIQELKQSIRTSITELAKEKFKYNIQQAPMNELLEDIRNSKNFRGTVDDTYKAVDDPNSTFGIGGYLTAAGTGPAKSYYMSNHDFLFSNSLEVDPSYPNKPEVQSIILNEFQPDKIIYLNELLAERR